MDATTDDLLDRLGVWRRAGLVTDEQVAAIADFERAHPRAVSATSVAPQPSAGRRDRTTVAEAIGYVGAALVLGAVGLFLGEFWDALTTGGQLALAVLVTGSLAGAGIALWSAPSPPLRRLTSVLFAGVVVGVAWSAAIAGDGVLGWSERDVTLGVGCAMVAVALPLHLVRPRALQQLALLGSVMVLLGAVLARPQLLLSSFWLALPFAALGVVWLLLGEGGYLRPRRVAGAAGGALALLSLQVGSFGELRPVALLLALAVAGGLVTVAVAAGGLHHLGVGAVGLFVTVPQLVFEAFGDAIGAPATLLLVGILLVLLAVGLGRARREVVPTGGGS